MKPLSSTQEFDAAVDERSSFVLLKHGATCPISARARDEVAAFEQMHPALPVYGLDVTAHRDVAAHAAERLGVEHASPQVFVMRGGRPVWHAEHYDITERSLAAHTASD
jgi:bacillithiol system protein YtxJ